MNWPRSLLLVAAAFAFAGCNHTPRKPDTVPASAVWSGGPDGGAFIDCAASQKGEPNPCTVYNDNTGDVYMSGKFVLEGQTRGARAEELIYGDADGSRIHLQNRLVLSPLPTQRPASVPDKAMIAENGVYVDCQPDGSKLYKCSLFLAANGEKFFSGSYRCDESLSVRCDALAPKNANRSAIDLQNAGALNMVK